MNLIKKIKNKKERENEPQKSGSPVGYSISSKRTTHYIHSASHAFQVMKLLV